MALTCTSIVAPQIRATIDAHVSEVGKGVGSLNIGDSVIIPFATAASHIHDSLTIQMYGGYGNGGRMDATQGQF